jgi:hypothetical protein
MPEKHGGIKILCENHVSTKLNFYDVKAKLNYFKYFSLICGKKLKEESLSLGKHQSEPKFKFTHNRT